MAGSEIKNCSRHLEERFVASSGRKGLWQRALIGKNCGRQRRDKFVAGSDREGLWQALVEYYKAIVACLCTVLSSHKVKDNFPISNLPRLNDFQCLY